MRLVEVVAASGRRLADLRKDVITEYPQILRNVRVADAGRLEATDEIWMAVEQVEARMDGEGRVLVRASGTEPLVRVMVEAASKEDAATIADELVAVVRANLT